MLLSDISCRVQLGEISAPLQASPVVSEYREITRDMERPLIVVFSFEMSCGRACV